MSSTWKVGEVARMAHVTVRTLHHYDEIGLLRPSERSDAGYRLYTVEDLERLHQILLFRELGLPLDAIGALLDDPAFDRLAALREQREELRRRIGKTRTVLATVNDVIHTLERGMQMSGEQMFQGFEAFDHAKHADEAKERWGDTEAYRESTRRMQELGKEDLAGIEAEGEAIWTAMAALMADGEAPTTEAAMDLAEAARRHIGHFYECGHAMHRGLADMYEADPRFSHFYERRAEGLTAFVATAIRANADRSEGADADGEISPR